MIDTDEKSKKNHNRGFETAKTIENCEIQRKKKKLHELLLCERQFTKKEMNRVYDT